nr:hypothetical protein [Mycobacterium intracellulare]
MPVVAKFPVVIVLDQIRAPGRGDVRELGTPVGVERRPEGSLVCRGEHRRGDGRIESLGPRTPVVDVEGLDG